MIFARYKYSYSIQVLAEGLSVDFEASPTEGTAPLEVQFQDQSTGDITNWDWNFGDGESSTLQNSTHTYISEGNYTVDLTVTGPGGSDTKTRTNYIEVTTPETEVHLSADTTVNKGDSFTIDVIIKNVANLGSFQFDCKYLRSIVKVDDVQMGPFLGSTNRTVSTVGPVIDNTSDSGKVTFGGFSFGSADGPSGTGILAAIHFTAQNTGTTVLNLINVQATDVNGSALDITSIIDGTVTVTQEFPQVDPTKTTVEANPDTIPANGVSTSTITVVPKSSSGSNLVAGQAVSLTTTAGTLIGSISDNGDGTYTQLLRSSTTPCTATITAIVNGVEMIQKPVITFTQVAPGITISIVPSPTSVVVGEDFTVDVTIVEATNLGSFQFDIEFLTNIVYASDASLGDFLASSGRNVAPVGPEIDNASDTGKVTFGGFSFGTVNGPDGSGVLASITFTTKDTGITTLNLKNLQLTDVDGLAQYVAVVNNGLVEVTEEIIPVDADRTLIEASPDSIPADALSTCTIRVTPKDSLGNNLAAGQSVNLTTTAGTLLGTITDNGDGTYTQLIQSSVTPETAIITATVNGIEMNQKLKVVFTSISSVTVKIQPSGINIDSVVTEVFTLDIIVENVENLGSFQFDIEYLSGVIYGDDAWLGDFLSRSGRNAAPIGPIINNTADTGKVTFGGFSFGTNDGPQGSGILATIQFKVQASGYTEIKLSNVQITDINGQELNIGAIGNGMVDVSTTVDNRLSHSLPEGFSLSQNYPNPFNPNTTIKFQLTKSGWVNLQICNIKGQKIITLIDQNMQPGNYNIPWDGTDENAEQVPSGIYIYQIQANGLTLSRKMIKLK